MSEQVAAVSCIKDAAAVASNVAWTARFHLYTAGWEPRGPFLH